MKARSVLFSIRQRLLEEEEKPVPGAVPGATEKLKDSLDMQLDRYLNEYLSEAMNAMKEGRDFRALQRRLLEADEEEPAADASAKKVEKTVDPVVKNIDVRNFAESVSRLVNNAENLLEFKNTILRRASNFLLKNSYDKSILRQLEIVLEDEHGLYLDKTEKDVETDVKVPTAERAGPMGG
jgi:hypothetical protein